MQQLERLFEEDRKSRRTIADAIEVLRKTAGFIRDDRAVVAVGPLKLPSGDVAGLVQIFYESPLLERVFVVSLPTSTRFRALRQKTSTHERFDIFQLNGAVADGQGNVVLTDSQVVRAVEVLPAKLPLEPTRLEWRIVELTISIIGADDRCYRSVRQDVPESVRETVPDVRVLDCSKLSSLKVPPLKVLVSFIAERDPSLKVSPQKIADALRTFGIRIPTRRPRAIRATVQP